MAREWRDWKESRRRIEEIYGYQKYGGNCHIIPNCAVVLLSLYTADDFVNALMIGNTSGWDTDCNSGNVGCLTRHMNLKTRMEGPEDRVALLTRKHLRINGFSPGRSIAERWD